MGTHSDRARARASSWMLTRIPMIAAAAAGGGCSQPELAAALHVHESSPALWRSLWACYRKREIDLCRGYVVMPAPRPADAGGAVPLGPGQPTTEG